MLTKPDLRDDAPWKQRLRAWTFTGTRIARMAPQRGLAVSNRSGVYQLYAWGVASGELRQLTDRPTGQLTAVLDPGGRFVAYLDDQAGNEVGHLVRVPWEGGEPVDMTPEMDPYALAGVRVSHDGGRVGFTTATRDGFQLFAAAIGGEGELTEAPRPLFRSRALARGPVLSHDGDVAVIASTERSGTVEFSLVALDTATGERLGELYDEGANLEPANFSPVAGDVRLLASSTRTGARRPLIWNLRTGERTDLEVGELDGDLIPGGWSSDGRRIIMRQIHQAVQRLFVYEVERGELRRLDHPPGTFGGVYFSPEGEIFAELQDSSRPTRLVALDPETGAEGRTLLRGGEAPTGRRWESVSFPSTEGVQIQGWLGTPDGEGPFPTILETHGGPAGVMTEVFSPPAQSWLDHGFAYLTINYRGSTTFGREFEKAIYGDIGHWEVDDMAAAHEWLVSKGVAAPEQILLTGWSYGGYLTLLALGRRPDLWAGGMAGIAIADWTLMYEDCAETLRQYQVGLFGGTPEDKSDEHERSSPITAAERVRAPVMVIQGRNDTRCPARQLERYEEKMLELGKSIQVDWFDAGHGSYAIEQSIEHQELMLHFAFDVLAET